jgi:hypothetical protein
MKQRKESRAFGINFVFRGMLTGGSSTKLILGQTDEKHGRNSIGLAGRRNFRTQTDFHPAVRLTNENYAEIHLQNQFVQPDPLRTISR